MRCSVAGTHNQSTEMAYTWPTDKIRQMLMLDQWPAAIGNMTSQKSCLSSGWQKSQGGGANTFSQSLGESALTGDADECGLRDWQCECLGLLG